jgi:hypothetical protein
MPKKRRRITHSLLMHPYPQAMSPAAAAGGADARRGGGLLLASGIALGASLAVNALMLLRSQRSRQQKEGGQEQDGGGGGKRGEEGVGGEGFEVCKYVWVFLWVGGASFLGGGGWYVSGLGSESNPPKSCPSLLKPSRHAHMMALTCPSGSILHSINQSIDRPINQQPPSSSPRPPQGRRMAPRRRTDSWCVRVPHFPLQRPHPWDRRPM